MYRKDRLFIRLSDAKTEERLLLAEAPKVTVAHILVLMLHATLTERPMIMDSKNFNGGSLHENADY